MRILITGTSSGIGLSAARFFLSQSHVVYGIDVKTESITHKNYKHYVCDVGKDELPNIPGINILVNNAGTIDESKAIETNLIGYIRVTEKYAYQSSIKSVVIISSVTGINGMDFPNYAVSQGGRITYAKHLAIQLGNKYKATVNSISPGACQTNLEPKLYAEKELVEAVAKENILKKWIEVDELAELIYFMTVTNKSITGQDILIDNGETSNYNFIQWR
jgi:3-oxoacyl-[acyl-carrier protein] reductase